MNKTALMFLYGPLETDARVLRSIEAARQVGLHVIILTCNTNKSFQAPEGVEMINFPFVAFGSKSYIKFCRKCVSFFIKNRRRVDVLYMHDFFLPFVGLLLLPFKGSKKYIYDAHELIIVNKGEPVNLRDKFFIWAEKKIIKHTNIIIQANKEREAIFKERYPYARTSNVLNITKFLKIKERTLDKDNITLVYQGNMGEDRKLSFFIDAMAQIENMKLLMIGSGRSLEEYKKRVKELGIEDKVEFTGRLSNTDMMERMENCSIGIISYPFTNLNNIYCSPNKIFEYAAISLPYIATAQPFIKEVQEKYNIGRTFEIGDISSFKENIELIIKNYSDYTKNTNQFLKDYSYENELKKMVDIFNKVLSN